MADPQQRLAQRRRTDGARILLIEDDRDLRRLLEITLEHDGYAVDAVASAEDAMRLLQTREYLLVLSDYGLPGKSGVWLLSEAGERGLLRGAVTRLVTAEPDAPEITPAFEVVPKPIDFEAFLPQIRAILASTIAVRSEDGDAGRRRSRKAVELVLYVSSESLPCARAVRVMRRLLDGYDRRRVRFEICNVAENPVEAAADHILFTPSLVRRSPRPRLWVIGDFARGEVVLDLLRASGCATPADGSRARGPLPPTPARTRQTASD